MESRDSLLNSRRSHHLYLSNSLVNALHAVPKALGLLYIGIRIDRAQECTLQIKRFIVVSILPFLSLLFRQRRINVIVKSVK